jgi:ABC-type oligopeptide transport system substrate-binding subunit
LPTSPTVGPVARLRADDPLRKVQDVRAIDAKTVRVSFSSPIGAWRELFSWTGGPEPGRAVEIWRCGGASNFTGYCNREVTRKLLQSQVIIDQRTRMRLFNRVDALMARDVPMIPLYQQPWFLTATSGLRGVRNNPWEGFTWNSEDWWLQR